MVVRGKMFIAKVKNEEGICQNDVRFSEGPRERSETGSC